MKYFFNKSTPLTISMWDYSWLKCGHPGGAFHDLARCVAEAAERGYNTLRIDAFPHAYVQPQTHFRAEPLFSLWQDADWHYRSNAYISNSVSPRNPTSSK